MAERSNHNLGRRSPAAPLLLGSQRPGMMSHPHSHCSALLGILGYNLFTLNVNGPRQIVIIMITHGSQGQERLKFKAR